MDNEQEIIKLGIVGIKNMGVYDADTTYTKLNVVTYNGSSYCALQNTKGNLPTNTDYWQLYAGKGDVGPEGPQGPKPVKGVDYYTASDISDLESTLSDDVTTEVSSQLSELTSATPLAASSTAGMTDTTRIYVNTTDGHWYWYDGDSWEDGGVYQASVLILDNTLASTSDAPASNIVGKGIYNLADTGTLKTNNNTSFSWESGTITATGQKETISSRIRTQGFIYVKAGSYLYCENGYKFGCAIYDLPDDSTFVSRTNINNEDKTIQNDCYIKLIMALADDSTIPSILSLPPHLYFFIMPALKTNEIESGIKYSPMSGIIQLGANGWVVTENANNSHYKFPVTPGETYHFKYTYTRGEPSVIIVDSNEEPVYTLPLGGSTEQKDFYLTIPSNSYELGINYNINNTVSITKITNLQEEINNQSSPLTNLKLLHSNVGHFDYGDEQTSDLQYIKNWKQMLNDNNSDILCFCEWVNEFNNKNMVNELINPLMRSCIQGNNNALLTSYKGNITNLGILQLTRTVGDLTTYAYHALKSKITINGKDIYIYECHLAYSPGYEALRQAQYQDLIDDASENNYQYVIFMGDFNAQVISEYDIFKNNGYTLSNGGYTGEYNTLRDITADNIIFSSNMKLNTFKVIDEYNLNTDHKPIYAELNF